MNIRAKKQGETEILGGDFPPDIPLYLYQIDAYSPDGRYVAFKAEFDDWLEYVVDRRIIVDTVTNKELIMDGKYAVLEITEDGIASIVDRSIPFKQCKVIKIDIKEQMK